MTPLQRFTPQCRPASARRLWLLAALFALASATGAANAACDALTVHNARVPAAPPGVPMAAYFDITNSGDSAVELTDVSSQQFQRASMHKSVINDQGMATMHPVESLTLAPGETAVFKHGSYHVMLFHPTQALAPGDTVTLALHCSDSSQPVKVTAEVRKRMSMDSGMSHHGHMQHGMDGMQMQHHGDMKHGMKHDMNMHHDDMDMNMNMDHAMHHEG